MPKFCCKCGFVISLVGIPCMDGYKILSEEFVGLSLGRDERGRRLSAVKTIDQMYDASTRAYRCPICGRLRIFWEISSDPRGYSYVLEHWEKDYVEVNEKLQEEADEMQLEQDAIRDSYIEELKRENEELKQENERLKQVSGGADGSPDGVDPVGKLDS